jgi:hypothetical protein
MRCSKHAIAFAFVLSVSAAARAQPSPIPPAPHVIEFLDGNWSMLAADYRYEISGQSIVIPRGFVTDFASIPPKLQSVLRAHGRYSRAAIIHDFLYWAQPCSRRQADNIMRLVMRRSGVDALQLTTIFKAVDWFGKAAWNGNRALRDRGVPHVVPIPFVAHADTRTWDATLDALIEAGVRDPQFSVSPTFCALGGPGSAPPEPPPPAPVPL